MNERIKELRKFLKLSQEVFGLKLGVTKAAISKMEIGNYNITDTMTKLICMEYNVNYIWLTTGMGEMFSDNENDYAKLIDRTMAGENEFAKNIFKMFSKFNENDWVALENMIKKFPEIKNNLSDNPRDDCPKTAEELERLFPPIEIDRNKDVG